MKKFKLYLISILLFGFLICIIFEVIFQILPVSDFMQTMELNKKNPYIRKTPKKEYFVSIGNFFQIRNSKKTNNAGYFSDIDFLKNKQNISIIGDSYVEALQVSNNNSIGGIVNKDLSNSLKINAYPIGYSGSPLSQYLAFAQMAKDLYNPLIYVFVIIGNDFDESYFKYVLSPAYYYYDENYNLMHPRLQESSSKNMLQQFSLLIKKSAFVRYFTINNYLTKKIISSIKQNGLLKTLINSFKKNIEEKNIINKDRYEISYRCIDQFLIDLNELVDDKEVIFLIDGLRQKIYRNDSLSTDFEKYHSSMNDYLINSSLKYNFSTINLDESFKKHYKINKKKFNFDIDNHWNELGHEIASEELLKKVHLLLK